MGRRIKYASDCPLGTWCDVNGSDYQTMANNRLLISILGVYGIDVVTYGDQAAPDLVAGPLPGL